MDKENLRQIIVLYEDGSKPEIFNEENIEYFIQRRIGKSGQYPEEAYYIEPFDFKKIVVNYENKLRESELKEMEEEEKREYRRLKRKFEGSGKED